MENKSKKNKRKTHIFTFFIKMCLLFIIVQFFSNILPSFLAISVQSEKYGFEFIIECFLALFILIVLLLSKNHYIFTEKRENFLKSLILGVPILIFSIFYLIFNAMTITDFNLFHLINIILYCFSIGVAEEFMCRGWLQNEFIERYSKNRKQVILSILLSSLVFGLMHLSNVLSGQTLFETIIQIIQATAAGFLFGSIYYRTKNIWSVVFLHAFYDFSIMISEIGVLKDCTYNNNPATSIVVNNFISTLIIIAIYFITSTLLLRKSKITDLEEKVILSDEDLKRDQKKKKRLIIELILLFIIFIINLLIPRNLKDYEDYQTCYEFTKYEITYDDWMNTEIHLPNYENYTINYFKENKEFNLVDGINSEIINNEEIKLKFYLDDMNNNLFTVENINTGKKITLDYKYINEFEILENPNNYIIVIHEDSTDSIIYYSNFITKENISNSNEYLDDIKKSFKKFITPNLSSIGYLTTRDNDYKYPYFITSLNDTFIINEDNNLYLLTITGKPFFEN